MRSVAAAATVALALAASEAESEASPVVWIVGAIFVGLALGFVIGAVRAMRRDKGT